MSWMEWLHYVWSGRQKEFTEVQEKLCQVRSEEEIALTAAKNAQENSAEVSHALVVATKALSELATVKHATKG